MSNVGTVIQLLRYPVKSMLGERLDAVHVTQAGLAGDRAHAFVDVETARVASAKRPQLWRDLLGFRAVTEPSGMSDGEPVIRIIEPDGSHMPSTQAQVNERVSRALGRPVRLVAARPEDIEIERSHPDVVVRDGEGAAATFDVMPLGREAPAGGFFDYAPLHIMCTASLAKIAEAAPESQLGVQRYRPNIVIDNSDGEAFVENAWVGRDIAIGHDLVVRILAPTPRCAVPTLRHGEIPAAIDALKTIAALNRAQFLDCGMQPCLGAYAAVVHPGEIRCGDTVALKD